MDTYASLKVHILEDRVGARWRKLANTVYGKHCTSHVLRHPNYPGAGTHPNTAQTPPTASDSGWLSIQ